VLSRYGLTDRRTRAGRVRLHYNPRARAVAMLSTALLACPAGRGRAPPWPCRDELPYARGHRRRHGDSLVFSSSQDDLASSRVLFPAERDHGVGGRVVSRRLLFAPGDMHPYQAALPPAVGLRGGDQRGPFTPSDARRAQAAGRFGPGTRYPLARHPLPIRPVNVGPQPGLAAVATWRADAPVYRTREFTLRLRRGSGAVWGGSSSTPTFGSRLRTARATRTRRCRVLYHLCERWATASWVFQPADRGTAKVRVLVRYKPTPDGQDTR